MTQAKLVAILSKKGGVGKTLVSMGLAQALSSAGHPVAVVDHDPEGSASSWAFNAAERDPLPFPVIAPVDLLRAREVSYFVVDTPPNDVPTLQQVAARADIILVPVLPGAGEMDRLQETMAALGTVKFKEGVQIGFVLNRLEHNKVSEAMPAAMEALGYPVVAEVWKSVEYQRAFGSLIPEAQLAPFRSLLEELEIVA